MYGKTEMLTEGERFVLREASNFGSTNLISLLIRIMIFVFCEVNNCAKVAVLYALYVHLMEFIFGKSFKRF